MARAAIIGCGMIAGRFEDFSSPRTYSHAKAYAQNSAFEMLALCDQSRTRAQELASKAHAVVFDTIDEILDNFAPDIVSICTPDNYHVSNILAIITHPRAPALVFCEKPICETREEFDAICSLEQRSLSRIIINHSRRFDPAHQKLKELISSGDFGRLVQAHVNYYGGWRHLGVHIVDILQYLFSEKIKIIETSFCCSSRYENDPTLNILGSLGEGILRMSGFPESYYQIVEISLLMECGLIRISDFGQSIEIFHKIINSEGERVLERDNGLSGSGMREPIVNAVKIAADYLINRDPLLIEPFDLTQAGITMETLWEGDRSFVAQS